MMSLEEERDMLALLLVTTEKLNLPRRSKEEQRESLAEAMGPAAAEQMLAAVKETATRFGPEQRMQYRSPVPKAVRKIYSTYCMAGVLRCSQHACSHYEAGERPLLAMLAARVICCTECEEQFRPYVLAADARSIALEDLVCDYCLQEGYHFRMAKAQFGPVTLIGDLCDQCAVLFQLPE